MKLRWRLMLSYLALIAVILVIMGAIASFSLEDLAEQNQKAAQESVQSIADANLALSESVLTAYGEKMVLMKAVAVAKELAPLLEGKTPADYPALRQDQPLREIATQDIVSMHGRAGYIDVLDDQGVAVLHPNQKVEGRNFSEWKDKYPQMWALVQRSFSEDLVQGYYTFMDRDSRESRKFMVLARVPGTSFILVAAVNINQYFLPVHQRIGLAAQLTLTQALEASQATYQESRERMQFLILAGLAFSVLVGLGFGLWFAGRLSRPMQLLRQAVSEMGKGNFKVQVPPTGSAETRALARAFNLLGHELEDYMARLKDETSAREAMVSEMRIARQIQESLLPHSFPPFPERNEFSLFAKNLPAREVAGDFYDFFFVGPQRLALIMGDVSGKGVHAALFMAITRTLLRNVCPNQPDPARALDEVNLTLCKDNDMSMFVTLFLAYYDVNLGSLVYANAGHLEPLAVGGDAVCRLLPRLGDVPLGVVPGHRFHKAETRLAPGELLFTFTDGIVEAVSPQEELFGDDRLHELLCGMCSRQVDAVCQEILDQVERFQEGERADDITILALRNRLPAG